MSGFLKNSISSPAPFDAIAESYDTAFSDSQIGRSQRAAVWTEVDRVFHPGQRVLEINCGTGIDAAYMASRGIRVTACDSAPSMIAVAQRRSASLRSYDLRFECLRTENIREVVHDATYDGLLSNFSGLNCVSDLQPVARNLAELVRPGGKLILCVFGRFCLWEVLWYAFSEKPEKALRRFRRNAVASNLAPGVSVAVHYWSVKSLREVFAPHFRLERRRGIGVVTPPSYAGSVAVRFPRLFHTATKIDWIAGSCPGIRAMADHVVLTFERVERAS